MNKTNLFEQFLILSDPRQETKIAHNFFDILFLTLCSILCGSKGWKEIEAFGECNLEWLRNFREFENGVPSHDTIARTVSMVDPDEFSVCFAQWMKESIEHVDGRIKTIAIDGKSLRGTYDKERKTCLVHMVSAFAVEYGVVLGQVKTEEKSNEITAIPELLKLLDVKDAIVTIDAMGCQVKIAQQIVDQKGDYLLAVKGNQGRLNEAFNQHFNVVTLSKYDGPSYSTEEKAHGRTEKRMYFTCEPFDEFVDLAMEWPELKTLGIAVSHQMEGDDKAGEVSIRYYISSAELDAESFAHSARGHWGIESMHWSLDVSMREDECQILLGNGGQNFARFRHIALNLLKKNKGKDSVNLAQMKSLMNDEYREKLIFG